MNSFAISPSHSHTVARAVDSNTTPPVTKKTPNRIRIVEMTLYSDHGRFLRCQPVKNKITPERWPFSIYWGAFCDMPTTVFANFLFRSV